MRGKAYEVDSAVKKIVHEGHGFKHVAQNREAWAKLGVTNKTELENYIKLVLLDKDTKVFQAVNGRDLYFNDEKKVFVSIDLENKHGGSCFIPPIKKGQESSAATYFDTQHKIDTDYREKFNYKIKKSKIVLGGYNALYKGKVLNPSLVVKYERRAEKKSVFLENRNEFARAKQRSVAKQAPKQSKKERKLEKTNTFLNNKADLLIKAKQVSALKAEEKKSELKKDAVRQHQQNRMELQTHKEKQANLLKEISKQKGEEKAAEKAKQAQRRHSQQQIEIERKREAEAERKRQIEEKQRALREAREAQFKQNQLDISKNI